MPPIQSSDGQPEVTPTVTVAETNTPDVNSTPQSSSEGDKGAANETLLDRFTKLSESGSEEGKSPDPQSGEGKSADGTPPAAAPAAGDGELGEVTKEELDTYKPLTRKRIETLLRQRTEAQEETKTIKEATATLEPRAKAYDQMATFVQKAGLTTEEVNKGFQIMSLLRNDPAGALEALRPYVTSLEAATGEALPADLQAKVDAGQIDEETAKETSRLRATQTLTTEQIQARDQRQAQEQVQNLASAVGTAVSAWEAEWKRSDPDYSVLQPSVQREIERLLLSGQLPKDPADAQAMATRVREQIRKEMSAIMPKKTAITPVTGTVQRQNAPAPTTMLEAIQRRAEGTF